MRLPPGCSTTSHSAALCINCLQRKASHSLVSFSTEPERRGHSLLLFSCCCFSNIFISVLLFIYLFICQPLLCFELRTEAVSFSCWLHNFQYSHPYRSTDRLSPPPPPPPPHPEQRTNQHHGVIAPRRSSAKFGEAKMFIFCISIDRTTK